MALDALERRPQDVLPAHDKPHSGRKGVRIKLTVQRDGRAVLGGLGAVQELLLREVHRHGRRIVCSRRDVVLQSECNVIGLIGDVGIIIVVVVIIISFVLIQLLFFVATLNICCGFFNYYFDNMLY